MTTFYADEEALTSFSSDVGALWCRPVDVLDAPPDSFVFLRGIIRIHCTALFINRLDSHLLQTMSVQKYLV